MIFLSNLNILVKFKQNQIKKKKEELIGILS